MDVARVLERRADAPDAPVHHVRGRDDLDARLGLRERLPHKHVQRLVVEDVSVAVDHAVLPVRGVGIERDVGHDPQFREPFLQGGRCPRHQAARVIGLSAVGGFQAMVDDGEEREHRNAELEALAGDRQKPVDAHARNARH